MVVGKVEEDAVGEFGDLDDEQWGVVADMVDSTVEEKEGLDEDMHARCCYLMCAGGVGCADGVGGRGRQGQDLA